MIQRQTTAMLLVMLTCCSVLWMPASSAAQDPIPGVPTVVQFRVTRTALNQPTSTYLFPMQAVTCGVVAASIPATGALASFSDPHVFNRFCYLQAAGNWSGLQPGVSWRFTIAAQGEDGSWSDESDPPYVTGKPNAPTGFGLRPTFSGVVFNGVVDERFPFAGLDVIRLSPDDQATPVYFGASTLAGLGFTPRPGDRWQVGIWR